MEELTIENSKLVPLIGAKKEGDVFEVECLGKIEVTNRLDRHNHRIAYALFKGGFRMRLDETYVMEDYNKGSKLMVRVYKSESGKLYLHRDIDGFYNPEENREYE